jgi:hypothetical protein
MQHCEAAHIRASESRKAFLWCTGELEMFHYLLRYRNNKAMIRKCSLYSVQRDGGGIASIMKPIVRRIFRREVLRSARRTGVVTVGEPQIMDAARMRAGCAEDADPPRLGGIGHIPDLHSATQLTLLAGQVCDPHGRAGQGGAVAARDWGSA